MYNCKDPSISSLYNTLLAKHLDQYCCNAMILSINSVDERVGTVIVPPPAKEPELQMQTSCKKLQKVTFVFLTNDMI